MPNSFFFCSNDVGSVVARPFLTENYRGFFTGQMILNLQKSRTQNIRPTTVYISTQKLGEMGDHAFSAPLATFGQSLEFDEGVPTNLAMAFTPLTIIIPIEHFLLDEIKMWNEDDDYSITITLLGHLEPPGEIQEQWKK